MEDRNHNSLTASVRKIVTTYQHKPNPSRRKKQKEQKKNFFDLTLFNNPGFEVSSDKELAEKDLSKLGTGSIGVLETETESSVFKSIFSLIKNFKGLESASLESGESVSFLKRDGRSKKFTLHVPGPGFKYDGLGLRDLRTSKDSRKLYLILNYQHKVSAATLKRKSASSVDLIDSDDDWDDPSLNDVSFNIPNRPSRSSTVFPKKHKQSCSDNPSSNSVIEIESNFLEEIKEASTTEDSAYCVGNCENIVIGILWLLHQRPFIKTLQKCLNEKGHKSSEIELCISQFYMLFGSTETAEWGIATDDICIKCDVSSSSTVKQVVTEVMTKISSLNCSIWQLDFLIYLNSKFTYEYFSSSDTEYIQELDSLFYSYTFNESHSSSEDMIKDKSSKHKVTDLPKEVSSLSKNGETVWCRQYFQLTPDIFVMFIDYQGNEKMKSLAKVIPKDSLEDIRSTNTDTLYLQSFISSYQGHYCLAVNKEQMFSKCWYLYANGIRHEFPSFEDLWKCLDGHRIILIAYACEELQGPVDFALDEFRQDASFLMKRLTERKKLLNSSRKDDSSKTAPKNGLLSLKDKISNRLDLIYGQNDLKKMIEKLVTRAYFNNKRVANEIGCSSVEENISRLHMIFQGNPGTGKTLAARQIAGILFDIGVISRDVCLEVLRKDLVAEHIGGTAAKTKAQVEKAMGGVLFVDEAYMLSINTEKDFGKEAIETLMSYMTPSVSGQQNPVMIFAGYTAEMKKFLETNAGLERRIKTKLFFKDFSPKELAEMTKNIILKSGLRCPHGIEEELGKMFSSIDVEIRSKYNGALCHDFFDELMEQQEKRLNPEKITKSLLATLLWSDIRLASAEFLSKHASSERYRDVSTQTPEIVLNIPNVGLVFSSP